MPVNNNNGVYTYTSLDEDDNGIKINKIATSTKSYAPQYGVKSDELSELYSDDDGNLMTRSIILTDEGNYRSCFVGSDTIISIGNGSIVDGSYDITGMTSLSTKEIRRGDYVIINSNYYQVDTFTDTSISLDTPYSGADYSGNIDRSDLVKNIDSGNITVASNNLTISSGATANKKNYVFRETDYLPLTLQFTLSLSQRIVNQNFRIGFSSDGKIDGTSKYYTYFDFNGTTATSANAITARNTNATPSGTDIITQALTIATTASVATYRIEILKDKINFYQNNVLLHTEFNIGLQPNDIMYMCAGWVNGGSAPASNTNAGIRYITTSNFNELTINSQTRDGIRVAPSEITAGNGTAGAVAQRVVLATDNSAVATAGLFSVKIDQTTNGTTNAVTFKPVASNGTTTYTLNSAATTNAVSVKASAGSIRNITITNTSASARYVKFYNKASAPTVGTDIPAFTIVLSATSSKEINYSDGLYLATGIAIATTTGIAYTDATAVTANDLQIAINYL